MFLYLKIINLDKKFQVDLDAYLNVKVQRALHAAIVILFFFAMFQRIKGGHMYS